MVTVYTHILAKESIDKVQCFKHRMDYSNKSISRSGTCTLACTARTTTKKLDLMQEHAKVNPSVSFLFFEMGSFINFKAVKSR